MARQLRTSRVFADVTWTISGGLKNNCENTENLNLMSRYWVVENLESLARDPLSFNSTGLSECAWVVVATHLET